jgi:iron complex outermembrane recepter protein
LERTSLAIALPRAEAPHTVIRAGEGGLRSARRFALLGSALWMLSCVGALADDTSAAAASAAGAAQGGVETVTVTAQKRTENVKDIPMSVSVVGGKQIEKQHILDYTDLARTVPGLSFSDNGGPGLDRIIMRGVSSGAGDATVGVYLDDVSITMPQFYSVGATQPRFFDLDRVEVLRGPQGTLYGASSMGGTLRFMSRQPDLDSFHGSFSSEVSGTKGGGINFEQQAVVNIPIQPGKAALRIGVDAVSNSGFIDHVSPSGQVDNKDVNSDRTGAIHATLTYKATDDLTFIPSLFVQRLKADDTSVFYTSLPKFQQNKLVAEPIQDTVFLPSLTIKDDLHWADFTSVTGYFERKFARTMDGTNYNSGFLASPGVLPNPNNLDLSPIASLPGPVYNTPRATQLSEELRLASKSMTETGLPYTWLAGIYLADQHAHLSDHEFVPGLGAAIQQIYGQNASNILGVPLTNDEVESYESEAHIKQYAGFGETTFAVTDKLKLTAGVRYLIADQTFNVTEGAFFSSGLPPQYNTSTKNSALTPKYAIDYAVTESANLYATAVKGFRLGGSNNPIPQSICGPDLNAIGLQSAPQNYDPDTLWSYEGGTKMNMFGNRLTVNADVYYLDWKNVQQSIGLPTCGNAFTANAGNAVSYGTELEVRGRVTPDLSLALAAGTTHARLTSVSPGTGASVGQALLGVPEWTMTLAFDYHHQINDKVEGFVRADWDWVGPSHGTYNQASSDYNRPTYDVVNASLGVNYGSTEVSLFAKNLFNQNKIVQRPSILFVSEGYTVRPLTVGLSVRTVF